MPGYLLLAGGAEFGGQMAIPDRRAIALAGGHKARVAVIPAAAAPDNNDSQAGRNAVRWFKRLGAERVESLLLVDRESADDPAIAEHLRHATLIYLLGGFPAHLADSLKGSLSWHMMGQALGSGAVIAGSSAGAMVLCSDYFDPVAKRINTGLGLIPTTCVIPHHDTFGQSWATFLTRQLPNHQLMGIDEETAVLTDTNMDQWEVHGKGQVTLYRAGRIAAFGSGHSFNLAI